MIFGLFVLGVALTISAVAAYYSIAGLCAIFAAAVYPIIIMGAALELGKIVATVWLHKFWHRAPLQFKIYLVPAIVVLMLVTSMGIFGFLSKAHMDQSVTVGDSSAQVQILDEKIKTEQDNIATSKKALAQMDSQVDQMLSRTTDDKGTNKAVQIRKQQAGERKSLQADIATAQSNIARLQEQRAPLAAQSRKIEAEVGPIKYIAALIYGDNPDANLLERAVRWVIILLVLVFDPLALILILAAEQTVEWSREDDKTKAEKDQKREGWHQEWIPDSEAWPEWDETAAYEPDDGPLTDEQLEAIKAAAGNVEMTSMSSTLFDTEREFFDHGREIAREIDANNGKFSPIDSWNARIDEKHNDGLIQHHTHTEYLETPEEHVQDQHPYLTKPWSWGPTEEPQGESAEDFINKLNQQFAPTTPDEETYTLLNSGVTINVVKDNPHIDPDPILNTAKTNFVDIPDMSITADNAVNTQAGFGTEFPANPGRGDMFLRVDYLPGKLFKWNGIKWIEVDKDKTDQFAYDQEYIKHLVEKIDSGEYDVDLLTAAEQEQISRYLNDTNQ